MYTLTDIPSYILNEITDESCLFSVAAAGQNYQKRTSHSVVATTRFQPTIDVRVLNINWVWFDLHSFIFYRMSHILTVFDRPQWARG